jgi:hypothetical protein
MSGTVHPDQQHTCVLLQAGEVKVTQNTADRRKIAACKISNVAEYLPVLPLAPEDAVRAYLTPRSRSIKNEGQQGLLSLSFS